MARYACKCSKGLCRVYAGTGNRWALPEEEQYRGTNSPIAHSHRTCDHFRKEAHEKHPIEYAVISAQKVLHLWIELKFVDGEEEQSCKNHYPDKRKVHCSTDFRHFGIGGHIFQNLVRVLVISGAGYGALYFIKDEFFLCVLMF